MAVVVAVLLQFRYRIKSRRAARPRHQSHENCWRASRRKCSKSSGTWSLGCREAAARPPGRMPSSSMCSREQGRELPIMLVTMEVTTTTRTMAMDVEYGKSPVMPVGQ